VLPARTARTIIRQALRASHLLPFIVGRAIGSCGQRTVHGHFCTRDPLAPRYDPAVTLADQYGRQSAWRDWTPVLDALPPLEGRLVLDLGCAVGSQASELARRGARVLGVDANEDLLAVARSCGIPNTDFRRHDLRMLPDLQVAADGVWVSFVAAYFPGLSGALIASWTHCLRPGGWIALTEIDDLFGHEPLGADSRVAFDSYADDALAACRYDFRMGRKLASRLEAAGLSVCWEASLADAELAFIGPASPEVLEAWRERLERMTLLRDQLGARFPAIREDFLACLAHPRHASQARVMSCIAIKSL
jgi:SAM-dependent methyltransferase